LRLYLRHAKVLSVTTNLSAAITVRPAYADDDRALLRLAALDSARPPVAPALLAEVDGELRAALSLADGRAIADPFHHTAGLVALLRCHAQNATAIPAARTEPRVRRRARHGVRFA
jgi:hypothetical protein